MLLVAVLIAGACSSNGGGDSNISENITTTSQTTAALSLPVITVTTPPEVPEEAALVVPFTAGNGTGTVAISGNDSPILAWFGNQPGEVSLDLFDADVTDTASVVEELVGFWFFQDDNSGDAPPLIYESSSDDITDSIGTSYVVEVQGLPPAPGTEITTTTTSTTTTSTTTTTSSVPSEDPETSVPPSTTSTTTTTAPVVESPVVLQVQVLNGSGVAGAAGRLTDKLSQAGYVVLPPENAPQRYSSSAVYFADGWQAKAEEILQAADIEEIEEVTAMPQQFASPEAAVVVLLGTDTAPEVVREQQGLRPKQRNDVLLPLADDVPRDRYVLGLAAVNLYTEQNENNPASAGQLADLAWFFRRIGYCSKYQIGTPVPESCGGRSKLVELYQDVEELLEELGFTPQNTCGAPAGYSFTDLLEPTREMDEEWRYYTGDAIFTTDRLIELHGGTRINPEANLDFYINQAVQTAHDALRIPELAAETESMQLILCESFLSPSGEVPEAANSLWYANLTPGIQPRESLLSQGTYHFKEISRNGNFAYLIVCHPTIGERYVWMWWRETGYRAEITGSIQNNGCQATYEADTYLYEDTNGAEDTFRFAFGERVFSAGDMLGFPRG